MRLDGRGSTGVRPLLSIQKTHDRHARRSIRRAFMQVLRTQMRKSQPNDVPHVHETRFETSVGL